MRIRPTAGRRPRRYNLSMSKPSGGTPRQPLIRARDQATVAVLVSVTLVALAWHWVRLGGHRGELIEIDRADPRRFVFIVDINTAGAAELGQIPGVGPVLAQRIIETRNSTGPFLELESLLDVEGIGPRTFARMEPYLLPLPAAENVAGHSPSVGHSHEQIAN